MTPSTWLITNLVPFLALSLHLPRSIPLSSPSLSLFLILPPVYFLFQSLFSHKKSSRRDIYKNWKSSTTQKWSEMNHRRKKKFAGCFNDTKKNYADAMMTRKHRSDAMITWTVWSDTMMQKGRLDMRKSECVNMKAKKPRAALCYYTDVNRKQTRGQLCIVNSKKSILRVFSDVMSEKFGAFLKLMGEFYQFFKNANR